MNSRGIGKSLIYLVLLQALLMSAPGVVSAVDRAELPDAGKTIGSVNQFELTPPEGKKTQIEIDHSFHAPMQEDNNTKIFVRTYKFIGQGNVFQDELSNLLQDSKNRELSFSQLQRQAEKITEYLRQKGYLVAKAYLPAQTIADGSVEIAVMIGIYDRISIQNHTSIKDDVLKRELGNIQSGAYIERSTLERAVWLLGDLAGADAKVTLSPGSKTGTSNLLVTVIPRQGQKGYAMLDNYGNRYTGSMEQGINYSFDNLSRSGDLLSMQLMTSGKGQTSGSFFYRLPFFGQGEKIGIGYSKVNYRLGEEFDPLDAQGTANVFKLSWNRAVHRSQTGNLYHELRFEQGNMEDSTSGFVTANKTSHAVVFSINGDSLDGNGASSYMYSYKTGRLHINNGMADTLNTGGSYGKFNINFVRQQYLNAKSYLLFSVNGQIASKNLDSSEKMSLGGANGVRAYPQGEASGDEGYLASIEWRWLMPLPSRQEENLQLAAFVDNGSVRINKNNLLSSDVNRRTLSAIGLGVLWSKTDDYSVRVNYAWKLGNAEAKSDSDKSGRLWLQGIKYF